MLSETKVFPQIILRRKSLWVCNESKFYVYNKFLSSSFEFTYSFVITQDFSFTIIKQVLWKELKECFDFWIVACYIIEINLHVMFKAIIISVTKI